MQGRRIALSRPRRFIGDLMALAASVPTVPVQRRMRLGDVAAARTAARVCWPAVFLQGYAIVVDQTPELRRAYLGLPWPHLREYPTTVATLAVEREFEGERAVFFGRIPNPSRLSLPEVHAHVRRLAEQPVETVPAFRKQLKLADWPRPIRRSLLRLGLNLPRTRPGQFGTFGLTSYSSLGAESLHPLSPLTTTLNYGVVEPDGSVWVRLVYDHRVFDGAIAARALARLEEVLTGQMLNELHALDGAPPSLTDTPVSGTPIRPKNRVFSSHVLHRL